MERVLALECGATSTRGGLYDREKALLAGAECGPSNPAEIGVGASIAMMAALGKRILGRDERIDCVAAGVSGAFDQATRDRLAEGLCRSLPASRARVFDDRWPILAANAGMGDGVVVIAGTGSSVLGQSRSGDRTLLGGRGGLIGDEGGAYKLALRGLRACAQALDGLGPETALLDAMLRAKDFATFTALNQWLLHADKREAARLAAVVTECAGRGDPPAAACVQEEAALLARQVAAAYDRLGLTDEAPLFLNGGLIEESAVYRQAFLEALKRSRPGIVPREDAIRGHRAVLEAALVEAPAEHVSTFDSTGEDDPALPLTEEGLDIDRPIDRLSPLEIVRLMNREDARVHRAVAAQEEAIAKAMEMAAEAFRRGGRLIYTGAGTSGRLGVLDAAECLPTFGVPADRVVGLIAGGEEALRTSVEGAEDDPSRGAADLAGLVPAPGKDDVVVGISASGTTPYVLGALQEANRRAAGTVLLTCNPACPAEASLVIALSTGPEVLPGSTRLKAGTATKMVLNMISTGAMARSGHVLDGLMVGMLPLNQKLRRRAIRIVRFLTGVDERKAGRLLDEAGGRIPEAVRKGVSGSGPPSR